MGTRMECLLGWASPGLLSTCINDHQKGAHEVTPSLLKVLPGLWVEIVTGLTGLDKQLRKNRAALMGEGASECC